MEPSNCSSTDLERQLGVSRRLQRKGCAALPGDDRVGVRERLSPCHPREGGAGVTASQ
jgi:hypothetical protein